MNVPQVSEIQQTLAAYLEGKLSLADFNEWLAVNTWDIEQSSDEEAQRIVYAIEGRLAEYSNGDWDEQELRDLLVSLLGLYVLQSSAGRPKTSTSARPIIVSTTGRPDRVSTVHAGSASSRVEMGSVSTIRRQNWTLALSQ